MRELQLRYFLAVVDHGSFTRAAERLLIAQPSLSQQVAALERCVGGKLLERLPRGVRLTPAGKAFEPEARAVLSALDRAQRVADDAFELRAGELELATVRSVAVGILPRAISRWRQESSQVAIGLREYRHPQALELATRAGTGDLSIGPRPDDWSGEVADVGYEHFVVVASPDHSLARSDGAVRLRDLGRERWVLFDPSHGLHEVVNHACARAGITPSGTIRTSQTEAAIQLAAAGAGVALVPGNVVPPRLEAAVLPLDPPLVRGVSAYARGQFGPVARSFLDVLLGSTERVDHMSRKAPDDAWRTNAGPLGGRAHDTMV